MNTNSFKSIFTATLSLLVLFSTISIPVESHFCGATLIDKAIFSKATNCSNQYCKISKNIEDNQSCCSDDFEIIKGQDELLLKFNSSKTVKIQKILSKTFHEFDLIHNFHTYTNVSQTVYKPPNIVFNLMIKHQVFLI